MYWHWESCIKLGILCIVSILNCYNLREFSITKAYANWGSRVLEKEAFTIYMEYLPSPSQQIPTKPLESITHKISIDISTGRSTKADIDGNFNKTLG